jgi:hypothetical protein
MPAPTRRKSRCPTCLKWFVPDPRLKGKQRHCGDAGCQRKRHQLNCKDWRARNPDYDRETRLRNRLRNGKASGACVEPLDGIDRNAARQAAGAGALIVAAELAALAVEMARAERLARGSQGG